MTKRAESKYKIDRRLGVNLWGRAKSPINKREYGPGQHGQRRKKPTDYGTAADGQAAAQGLLRHIGERQFRRIYHEAVRRRGDTGENLVDAAGAPPGDRGLPRQVRRRPCSPRASSSTTATSR